MTIAPIVTPRHVRVLNATNLATGMLTNIPKVMAAVRDVYASPEHGQPTEQPERRRASSHLGRE